MGFSGGAVVKNPPASAEDARDTGSIPGQEDPLEKEMAITPVFLPGESHGQWSLVGYSPWGCTELDMTEQLSTHILEDLHLTYVIVDMYSNSIL